MSMLTMSAIQIKAWKACVLLAVIPIVFSLEVNSWCPLACRCKRTDSIVDCSHAGLTVIPPNIPSDTVSLDMSANPLGKLTTFPSLGRLRVLRIMRHSLSELGSDALRPLKSLRVLDLSDNFLETIPQDMAPPSLDTLILAGNAMHWLENYTQPILNSQSLRTLDLSNCKIDYLPRSAFTSLHYLQDLDLSNNFIISLHPDLFSPLSALISLNLSNNQLNNLPNTIFENNPFLTHLNMSCNTWDMRFLVSNNRSTVISSSPVGDGSNVPILKSKSLEKVDFSGCWLSQLSSQSLAFLPNLRYLSISRTGLQRVERRAFEKLINLETLDISYNRFNYIYDDLFKNNPKLTSFTCSPCSFIFPIFSVTEPKKEIHSTSISYLNLEGSRTLRGVLTNLIKFPALTTLLMSDTDISSVSSTAFSLNHLLAEIDLSHCKLKQLPRNVFLFNQKLTKIKLASNLLGRSLNSEDYFPNTVATHLDLSDCYYQMIPKKYFSYLQTVVYLNLSGNPLLGWEDSTFSEMENLQSLDLSRTLLTHLDPNSFLTNSRLQSLFLSSVRLGAAISKNSFLNDNDTSFHFINIPMLEELDLSNCGIQHLTNGMFSGTPALQKLSLSGNGLRSLDLNVIEECLSNLKFLDLQANPWRCDCRLADIRDWWVERKMEPLRHWVICEEPEDLHDRTWDAIDNCSGSVSKKNNRSSSQYWPKEDESSKRNKIKESVKKGSAVIKSESEINEKRSTVTTTSNSNTHTVKSTTVIPVTKMSYKKTVKVTLPPLVTKSNHDAKHYIPIPFHKPFPSNPTTDNSLTVKRVAKGAALGFLSVTVIMIIGSILFLLVCRKTYRRLSSNYTSETATAWEL